MSDTILRRQFFDFISDSWIAKENVPETLITDYQLIIRRDKGNDVKIRMTLAGGGESKGLVYNIHMDLYHGHDKQEIVFDGLFSFEQMLKKKELIFNEMYMFLEAVVVVRNNVNARMLTLSKKVEE